MNKSNVGIKELIKELNIGKKEIEFSNDLNLFLDIVAFEDCDEGYYDVIKNKFNDYMGKWNIDLEDKFSIISQYIKSKKLPYKILKDEGFRSIKSEKFIVSMLVEIYAINIIIESNDISKNKLIKFIYTELKGNGLYIDKKDIILSDLDYIFRSKNLGLLCKSRLKENEKQLKTCLYKIKNEVEKRKEIKLDIKIKMIDIDKLQNNNAEENVNININISEKDRKLEEERLIDKTISEYREKEVLLKYELEKLQKENMELIEYGKEQYNKALIDLVKYMNDDVNGNLLDRLYCYLKGNDEVNIRFIISNLFNVFKQKGIFPREIVKLGSEVEIEEYSFYNYRLNKDISDIKLCSGEVLYPAWFHNDKEIIKPYVNIKGEK